MGDTIVKSVAPGEEGRAVHTVMLAFAEDPTVRWCWPDSQQYVELMPSFIRAFAGAGFASGAATQVGDFAGAALWLPPGVHPDEEAMGAIMEKTVAPKVIDDLMPLLEKAAAHHPEEPHWYLPLIGVDPSQRGNGYGGALLAHTLELCDRDGVPAYLESSNARNISLYLRHGFEILDTIQVGSSPSFAPMLRKPR